MNSYPDTTTSMEFCPLEEAKNILQEILEEGRRTLFVFGIPIYEVPEEKKTIRPYLSTFYNEWDLGNINIVAYLPELLSDAKDLAPEQFRKRIRSGIKEEAIHGIQILSVKLKFDRLPAQEKSQWRDACAYYYHLQEKLFEELCQTPRSRELLVAAGKLYYADPAIQNTEDLRTNEMNAYGRVGYVTIELVRQIIQARLGEELSEEAREKSWDKKGDFGLHAYKGVLQDLSSTIREHAKVPEEVSPMMAEIIRETESLFLPEPKQKTPKKREAGKEPVLEW